MPTAEFNGATVLHVHPTDHEAARILAQHSNVRITVSENAFPGRIYGFRGAEFMPCFEHRTEKHHA